MANDKPSSQLSTRNLLLIFLLIAVVLIIVANQNDKQPNQTVVANQTSQSAGASKSSGPLWFKAGGNWKCSIGTPVSGRIFVNDSEVPFMKGPGSNSGQVLNERATENMGKPFYYDVSAGVALLEPLCEQGDWVQVRVLTIQDDTKDIFGKDYAELLPPGWIEKRFIASELTEDQSRGLYWPIASSSYVPHDIKDWVRKGALKILADDRGCNRIYEGIVRSSLYVSTLNVTGDRTTSAICKSGKRLYGVPFDERDVTNGVSFAPEDVKRRIAESAANMRANLPRYVTLGLFNSRNYDGDLVAAFVVNNNSPFAISQVTIACSYVSPRHGQTKTLRDTLQASINPNGLQQFNRVNLGYVDPRISSVNCVIADLQ